MNSQLFRKDVKTGNKTTRYYWITYDVPINKNIELYFNIFTNKIEIEKNSREIREGGRNDRFINLDKRIKDDIYFTEHFTDKSIFSYIHLDYTKNNKFAWTRCKRLMDLEETEGLDPEKIKKIQDKIMNILFHSVID